MSECNLLGIKKLNKLINKYTKEIKKENINIIFNKYDLNSISFEILNKIFKNYKILGKINYTDKMEIIINTGKIIKIKAIQNDLLKIIGNLNK